ncbi:conserved hypothetical protein [Magnetospirillum molischianum DSM 120]|uniref:Uncharacterized protein n=1 Tax=Magnetospirillum molischianum DSM 120 TaxID=1150626 RepID=H8FNS5_MAGML|nr:conserved hypothetical protein [Magnetospirillum molischianum DSM 120]
MLFTPLGDSSQELEFVGELSFSMEAIVSLSNFQTYLYENFKINQNCPVFNCNVTYTAKGVARSIKTIARMSVGTMEFGEIHLTETEWLTGGAYHCDFSPQYQSYFFDVTTSSLIISGSSIKMDGNYKIVITPI